MSTRPSLLFYCQHSLGMGHLMRSFALARALAARYDVSFVNGGRFPPGIEAPDDVEVVQLTPLGMDEEGALVSLNPALTVEESFALRTSCLLGVLRAHRPRVVVVELYPFGRKKFARELVPLLEQARRASPAPIVLCSLRDILVGGRDDQQHFDDRAAQVLEQHFDGVLVHSDPQFARLDESFRPSRPLRVPVHYTGFVTGAQPMERAPTRSGGVLVSAGGGIVGGPLLRAALDAHRLLWPALRMPMTLVAGPFLHDAEWQSLAEHAIGVEGLELLRSVPDLRALMQTAALSVSQCGYNTAMDILVSGVKALVVPFARAQENEQWNRARRLAARDLVRVLSESQLDGVTLAQALRELIDFVPDANAFDLDGAAHTTRLITRLVTAADAMPLSPEVAR
jgi:predicted glycosyltransferase